MDFMDDVVQRDTKVLDAAWETLIDLELKAYKKESTLDLGEFLMIKGTK